MDKEIHKYLQLYSNLWQLIADGNCLITHSSLILPVLYRTNIKAILKIPFEKEEKRGCKLMTWWNGKATAKVFRSDENALLMERIISTQISLSEMASNNYDDKATDIICSVVNELHINTSNKPRPELIDLDVWFKDLLTSANKHGGLLVKSADIAKKLLQNQQERTILHGDIHHANILYSDARRSWLAIDPKALYGDRVFDYVNILCNPTKDIALAKGRFLRQACRISNNAQIDLKRLLEWVIAWSGLSACWMLNDRMDASLPLQIIEIAIQEINLNYYK